MDPHARSRAEALAPDVRRRLAERGINPEVAVAAMIAELRAGTWLLEPRETHCVECERDITYGGFSPGCEHCAERKRFGARRAL